MTFIPLRGPNGPWNTPSKVMPWRCCRAHAAPRPEPRGDPVRGDAASSRHKAAPYSSAGACLRASGPATALWRYRQTLRGWRRRGRPPGTKVPVIPPIPTRSMEDAAAMYKRPSFGENSWHDRYSAPACAVRGSPHSLAVGHCLRTRSPGSGSPERGSVGWSPRECLGPHETATDPLRHPGGALAG